MNNIPAPPSSWFGTKKSRFFYIVVWLISIILPALTVHLYHTINNTNTQNVVQSQNANVICPQISDSTNDSDVLAVEDDKSGEKCKPKEFKRGEWNVERYNPGEEGFWCPKDSFTDPVMWIREGFLLKSKKFITEYEVKKKEQNSERPLSFILEFAQKKDANKEINHITARPIYKLWTPEGISRQLFRFSVNRNFTNEQPTGDDVLTREPPFTLSAPVKPGGNNKMTIEITRRNGKEISMNFLYSYIPEQIEKAIEDSISKTVLLPVSDAETSSELFYYGVGTFKGNCIRIVSYSSC